MRAKINRNKRDNKQMTKFKTKKISSHACLGETLVSARKKREVSLREVARELRISETYLRALESGDYGKLPGDIYARNFLKSYARWLNLDWKQSLADYSLEVQLHTQTSKALDKTLDKTLYKTQGSKSGLMSVGARLVRRPSRLALSFTPRLFRQAFVGVLAALLLVYLGGKVRAIFSPPLLFVETPAIDLVTDERTIVVSGQADRQASLLINGQPVLSDDNGHFTEVLDLADGTNLIEIAAQKKHSQPNQVTRKIVVQADEILTEE